MLLSVRSPRASIAALLISSSLTIPLAARSSRAEPRAAAVDISQIRIDNFAKVDSTYYSGAQPTGGDYADLAALGVKTLINRRATTPTPASSQWQRGRGSSILRFR